MLASLLTLNSIRSAFAGATSPPSEDGAVPRAAVALVLHAAAGGALELLFIERAQRSGDPWSGHMAFPGGGILPADVDARRAAERETWEEVGVELTAANFVGNLGSLRGRPRGILVSGFVYAFAEAPPLACSAEVQSAFWFSVAELWSPVRRVENMFPGWSDGVYPGIRVGVAQHQVVWGLTYRFLESFSGILGRSLSTGMKPVHLLTGNGG